MKLRNVQTGPELLSLDDADFPLAISLDGYHMASNGADGAVNIQDATPQPEKPYICLMCAIV